MKKKIKTSSATTVIGTLRINTVFILLCFLFRDTVITVAFQKGVFPSAGKLLKFTSSN